MAEAWEAAALREQEGGVLRHALPVDRLSKLAGGLEPSRPAAPGSPLPLLRGYLQRSPRFPLAASTATTSLRRSSNWCQRPRFDPTAGNGRALLQARPVTSVHPHARTGNGHAGLASGRALTGASSRVRGTAA